MIHSHHRQQWLGTTHRIGKLHIVSDFEVFGDWCVTCTGVDHSECLDCLLFGAFICSRLARSFNCEDVASMESTDMNPIYSATYCWRAIQGWTLHVTNTVSHIHIRIDPMHTGPQQQTPATEFRANDSVIWPFVRLPHAVSGAHAVSFSR